MEIKICTTEDELDSLSALASEIWHEYFSSLLSLDQIDYMVDMFQSKRAIKNAIENDHYTYYLAYENNELIGYCGVKPEEERVFLSKLYLRKDFRGRGLASKLLKQAVDFAKENGKNAVYLTCNKYNTHSLDVYRAKGFKQIDSVVTDIGNEFVMDDYIMQLDI